MDYDQNEVDETVLALLCLTIFSEGGVTIGWLPGEFITCRVMHSRAKNTSKHLYINEIERIN